MTSGGIGGNHEPVRESWPRTMGKPPTRMLSGVPDHVDGRMLKITEDAGASIINPDRMWHYPEGIENWSPIWTRHGIRILPGPSPLWLDARGKRLPVPLFPGFDTLGTLEHLIKTGYDYSWFLLTQKIIEREFALSGSEQNPDLTARSVRQVLASRLGGGAPPPVKAFKRHGTDFIVEHDLRDLVRRMNSLTGDSLIDAGDLEREIKARDRELVNPYSKDLQVTAIHGARRYLSDRFSRVATPHRILDPGAGPLIAVRLWILTRKSLGGLETDLSSGVLKPGGEVLPGLYAPGEVAGFGGGGVHGYRSLEGTFLGGCLFSGRTAGRAGGPSCGLGAALRAASMGPCVPVRTGSHGPRPRTGRGSPAPRTPSTARPSPNNSTLAPPARVNSDSLGHGPSNSAIAMAGGPSVDLVGVSHLEGEHAVGVDAHVHRPAVEELLPIRAVAGHVHLEQRFAQAAGDLDRDRAAVDGDRELLAREMRGADLRAGQQVAVSDRVGSGPEVKRTAVEDPVQRSGDRATVGGHGGDDEQAHPGQLSHELLGPDAALRGRDAEQVGSGCRVAAVEQLLERADVLGRLVHRLRTILPPWPSRASRPPCSSPPTRSRGR